MATANLTVGGHLKLTNIEIQSLSNFVTARDQQGFYLNCYNMIGVSQAVQHA